LELIGFYFRSQKGSHGKFKNDTGKIVIIPMNKKVMPAGTFKNILNQAGISSDRFKELLKR
jgi:predicted RNA binding protein YcfA (HicA-like mRNA interferase family)